jgi:hypothetical protein
MFGGFVYTISSTSIPFKAVAMVLNSFDGITIEDIDGTLTSGFKVKRIALNKLNNGADFQLENLVVDYTLEEMDGSKKLIHVKNINIDKLILIGGLLSKTSTSSKISKHDSHKSQNSKTKDNNPLEEFNLIVDTLSIKNVILKENLESSGFSLDHFTIKNLLLTKDSFKFDKIDILSNIFKLSVFSKIIDINKTNIEMDGTVSSLAFDKLNNDLPFKMKINIEDLKKTSIKLSAFSDKMSLKLNSDKSGSLVFNKMDFTENFKNDWPISWLNGEITLPTLNKKTKMTFIPKGLIQFIANDIKYDVIEKTFAFKKSINGDDTYTINAQAENSKVEVKVTARENGEPKITITDI